MAVGSLWVMSPPGPRGLEGTSGVGAPTVVALTLVGVLMIVIRFKLQMGKLVVLGFILHRPNLGT